MRTSLTELVAPGGVSSASASAVTSFCCSPFEDVRPNDQRPCVLALDESDCGTDFPVHVLRNQKYVQNSPDLLDSCLFCGVMMLRRLRRQHTLRTLN